jgi:hypothetical protein
MKERTILISCAWCCLPSEEMLLMEMGLVVVVQRAVSCLKLQAERDASRVGCWAR